MNNDGTMINLDKIEPYERAPDKIFDLISQNDVQEDRNSSTFCGWGQFYRLRWISLCLRNIII